MSKTRADYGSRIARPKIDDKDNFELKGQFLKELRDNTFNGSDHEDANEHIKKVLEIADLFHIPNITQDQVMLRAFPMSLIGAILDSKGVIPSKIAADAKSRRLMFESSQTTIPFPSCLNDYYCEEKKGSYGPQFSEAYSYGASHIDNSIPQKEKDPQKKKDPGSFILPCYINNVCFDNTLADLGASISVMPLSTYLNLGLGELAHTKLTVELADRTVKYPKGIAENVLVGIGKFVFSVDFIILDMPEDVKVPLILGRPFFSTVHAKIDVFKRKITLRVGDEKIIFK
ncbi:putative ribonuclease H-like domain-containing protein, partial [Tanacetum coccineum]